MSELAKWLARRLWWAMLRFLRIRWIRRMRHFWLRKVPPSTARRMIRQDRFARRHGLLVLTLSLNMMLASFAVTGCYLVAVRLFESGILGPGTR